MDGNLPEETINFALEITRTSNLPGMINNSWNSLYVLVCKNVHFCMNNYCYSNLKVFYLGTVEIIHWFTQ